MKKSFTLLSSVFFLLCISYNSLQAQNKIIGEKSQPANKAIIGEKSTGIIGEEGVRIQKAKLKNEISSYYSDYLRKQAAASSAADVLRKKLQEAMKQLEAEDKMGNFEIQRLMSDYNQAETLSSQVQKKISETLNSVIGKI